MRITLKQEDFGLHSSDNCPVFLALKRIGLQPLTVNTRMIHFGVENEIYADYQVYTPPELSRWIKAYDAPIRGYRDGSTPPTFTPLPREFTIPAENFVIAPTNEKEA